VKVGTKRRLAVQAVQSELVSGYRFPVTEGKNRENLPIEPRLKSRIPYNRLILLVLLAKFSKQ
jgi:hypothetical protein